MKKSRKIVLILIVLLISFVNRAIYGTFNVFSYPNRVTFEEYYYYSNDNIVTLTNDEKPTYEVSKVIDRLTGKRIYSKNLNFIGNGKVVYLYLDGDRYLILGCDGGG